MTRGNHGVAQRARCHICHRDVAIKRDGKMRGHHALNAYSGYYVGERCRGSNALPLGK
jgi:hypothetical protein